jgi:hypothetical protein
MNAAVSNAEYDSGDLSEDAGSVSVDDANSLPVPVAAAIGEYATAQGLSGSDTVDYSYRAWSGYYTGGAEVELAAPGKEDIRYVLAGEGQYTLFVVFEETSAGSEMVCKELI